MMRSLYSAVSGLKNHQTKMDVIGNNISNVNTVAFKASSVTFSDIIYQNMSGASGPSGNIGGVNAKQIGLGVSTAATAVKITTAGAAQTTGKPFDLRLTDSNSTNFFIVDSGSGNVFTRDGCFYVDGNGTLCMDSTGYHVMGWQAVELPDGSIEIKKDTVSALDIMKTENLTSPPEATEAAYISGIIDKNTPDLSTDDGYSMSLNFYDDMGYPYTAKFSVKQAIDPTSNIVLDGQFTVSLTSILDQNNKQVLPHTVDGNGNVTVTAAAKDAFPDVTVTFDKAIGEFVYVSGNGAKVMDKTQNPPTLIQAPANNKEPVYLMLRTAKTALDADTTGRVPPETDTTGWTYDRYTDAFKDIAIDFSFLLNENNGKVSTAGANRGTNSTDNTNAGKKLGALTSISVQNSGKIYGSYDNGNTVLLGQIAVTQFANASGLEKIGESCYATTLNSGEFDGIGQEINADGSKMTSGELEMSNVDLSTEFTDMITTQRGFQANSRVITTSDSLLEELINLKR
ncbi:MAG: flagellar hook-basal body complex protein [Lachnospiraceae bacterium]|nr:flagellar hook-basal body complex protein [Lachnospiraceae bacterium]